MNRKRKLKQTMILLFIIIGLFFVINIIIDIFRTIYNFDTKRTIIIAIYFCVICIFIVLPSIVFLIYGRKLYQEVKKVASVSKMGREHLTKVCNIYIIS